MKERLVELLCNIECNGEEGFGNCPYRIGGKCGKAQRLEMCSVFAIADHLLANGVIVPPCKVGDTVWFPSEYYDKPFPINIHRLEVYEEEILMYSDGETEWHFEDIGKTVFLTKAEAEKALAERGCKCEEG